MQQAHEAAPSPRVHAGRSPFARDLRKVRVEQRVMLRHGAGGRCVRLNWAWDQVGGRNGRPQTGSDEAFESCEGLLSMRKGGRCFARGFESLKA